jgi:hypothetical protein
VTVLTAANPTMEALYGLLQDPTLQAAIGGRLGDDAPQDTPQPNVLVEILGEVDGRGLGTGGLPELDVRTHVFSDLGSLSEAQAINQQIVALLKDARITITGYEQCGTIVYRETVTLRDQELNGVKVHEVVSLFTTWCEQVAP